LLIIFQALVGIAIWIKYAISEVSASAKKQRYNVNPQKKM
jgi:hypothetical protein